MVKRTDTIVTFIQEYFKICTHMERECIIYGSGHPSKTRDVEENM